jgi:hypothetical protein
MESVNRIQELDVSRINFIQSTNDNSIDVYTFESYEPISINQSIVEAVQYISSTKKFKPSPAIIHDIDNDKQYEGIRVYLNDR